MKKGIVALCLLLVPGLALAGTITVKVNQEATLTMCQEAWPYDFDCVSMNGTERCVKKETDHFFGFPECTPEKTWTGTVFEGLEPERIYFVRAGEVEIGFIGRYIPKSPKPRRFESGGVEVEIISK